MSRLRRIGSVLMIVATLAATGTHWAVLQSVAWTAMLASNLQTEPLTEAVQRTFDGKHPCCLCKAIAAAKKSGKKNEFTLQAKRLDFLAATARFIFTAPTHFWLLTTANHFFKSLYLAPPTPPPRGVFA